MGKNITVVEMKDFTLKIGAHKIRVKHVSYNDVQKLFEVYGDTSSNSAAIGAYHGNKNQILIDKSQSGTNYVSILIHEIMECVNDKYGIELNHVPMTTVGEALTQIMLDNKKVFQGLLK